MGTVLQETRGIRILLAVIILLPMLTGCNSKSLPEPAKVALDKSIVKLAGAEVKYKIISAQKGAGSPEQRQVDIQLPSNSDVYGCPPDYGDRETWCVVIEQGITDTSGRTYSHFLLTRVGNSWYVEELTDAEAGQFDYFGCGNWSATR